MRKHTHANAIFALFFIFVFYLMYLMMKAYIAPIIFALILGGSFYPLLNYFIDKKGLKRNRASFLVILIMIISIVIPITFISARLSKEAMQVYNLLRSSVTTEIVRDNLFGDSWLANKARLIFELFNIDYNYQAFEENFFKYVKGISFNLVQLINNIFSNTLSFIYYFAVMFVMIYALFLEGNKLKQFLLELSPLPNDQEEMIIEKFNQMNYVTLVSNGLGGIIQGSLAGLGFLLVGIDSVILWSTLMIFLAFIPLIGISLVTIPAALILFYQGAWIKGLFILVFCTVVAFVVENVFKPKFIGDKVDTHSSVIFFSILGGISAFGMGGIFYGPLIIIIFLTMEDIYHKYYKTLNDQP